MAPIRANSNDDREGHSHHPCHMGRYQVEGHETAESLGGASQTLADHHLEGALEILDICRQRVGQQIIIHHMQEGGTQWMH
jgi:hypothetical protein